MATTRFDTTIKALEGGVTSLPAEKAITNIEGWEEYLSKHEHAGVKGVAGDLAKLKKLLQADELDDKAIKNLVHKLGKETSALAKDDTSASAGKIKELGEVLSKAS